MQVPNCRTVFYKKYQENPVECQTVSHRNTFNVHKYSWQDQFVAVVPELYWLQSRPELRHLDAKNGGIGLIHQECIPAKLLLN